MRCMYFFVQDSKLQTASWEELADQAEGNETFDRTFCNLTLQLNVGPDDVRHIV